MPAQNYLLFTFTTSQKTSTVHSGDHRVSGRKIMKLILKKQSERVLIKLPWVRIGSSGRLF
jgi:hypothetical protein